MHPLSHRHPCARAFVALAATMLSVCVTTAALAAAAALLGACGGGDAAPVAATSDVQMAVLDIDALGSIDAAAQEAAAHRGAPGEAEPVHYVVHARHAQRAEHVAAELTDRGFSNVRVAGAHDGRAASALSR